MLSKRVYSFSCKFGLIKLYESYVPFEINLLTSTQTLVSITNCPNYVEKRPVLFVAANQIIPCYNNFASLTPNFQLPDPKCPSLVRHCRPGLQPLPGMNPLHAFASDTYTRSPAQYLDCRPGLQPLPGMNPLHAFASDTYTSTVYRLSSRSAATARYEPTACVR